MPFVWRQTSSAETAFSDRLVRRCSHSNIDYKCAHNALATAPTVGMSCLSAPKTKNPITLSRKSCSVHARRNPKIVFAADHSGNNDNPTTVVAFHARLRPRVCYGNRFSIYAIAHLCRYDIRSCARRVASSTSLDSPKCRSPSRQTRFWFAMTTRTSKPPTSHGIMTKNETC